MAPWLIPKKIGLNTIISSTRNYIKPTNHWCKIYPNNYQQTRLHFKVKGFEQDTSGKKLSYTIPDKIFTAFVNSVKLRQPGSPNQLFANNNQQPSLPRPKLVEDDNDKDCKLIKDGAINGTADDEIGGAGIAAENRALQTNNPKTDEEWNWSAFFYSIFLNKKEKGLLTHAGRWGA